MAIGHLIIRMQKWGFGLRSKNKIQRKKKNFGVLEIQAHTLYIIIQVDGRLKKKISLHLYNNI